LTDVSEVLAAFIIMAMMETSQTTAIFIPTYRIAT
jgi:hypothetical protein